jgi:hypothetical protein
MSLRSHVHADKVLSAAREHPAHRLTADLRNHNDGLSAGAYGEYVNT